MDFKKPHRKTTAVCLDLSAAFDRVWRQKLIEILHSFGIAGNGKGFLTILTHLFRLSFLRHTTSVLNFPPVNDLGGFIAVLHNSLWLINESELNRAAEGSLVWYWARTCDKASHSPIPIPLGYRGPKGLMRQKCLRTSGLEYRTPDRKVWVRCPMPPNTFRVHTECMLVKSVGPKVLWAVAAGTTGAGDWRIFPSLPIPCLNCGGGDRWRCHLS
ncbi:hypothetical protein TNCV_4636831 [Trichonephila clavipes]|nr:hypothetical protein TNCV_4636831 [Trichonephila clavipes]